jgi:hypothetical protein
MPDDDVIYTRLVRGWHRAGKLFQSDAPAEEVADAVSTALCDTLRRLGGCPGLPEMISALEGSLRAGNGSSWGEQAKQLVRRANGHVHTRLLREVCRGLLASAPEALRQLGSDALKQRVTSEFVSRLAVHHLFSRLRPESWEKRGRLSLARTREQECRQALPITAIARRLLAHPVGIGLRAPARRHVQSSTEEMLAWPL